LYSPFNFLTDNWYFVISGPILEDRLSKLVLMYNL